MNKELLIKSMRLFENEGYDTWVSFYELANQKENLKNLWFAKLNSKLIEYFSSNLPKEWRWQENRIVWYLEGHGPESLGVWLEQYHKFSIWVNESVYDGNKIKDLLNTTEYSDLSNCFERIDKRFDAGYKIVELGNFNFNTEFDGRYDHDSIAWHAGVNTESYANQIIEKVERIIKNEVATEMFKRINQEAKK